MENKVIMHELISRQDLLDKFDKLPGAYPWGDIYKAELKQAPALTLAKFISDEAYFEKHGCMFDEEPVVKDCWTIRIALENPNTNKTQRWCWRVDTNTIFIPDGYIEHLTSEMIEKLKGEMQGSLVWDEEEERW